MLAERLPRFNDWLREAGLSDGGFRMGIGLNSGPVMSGSVGSERRLEYTAVGDTTNAAARLEGMTKDTDYQALVRREHVGSHAAATAATLAYLGEVRVTGRSSAHEGVANV